MTFWVWVVILAALLFFPVTRIVWVLSVRRLQRKQGRELLQPELDGQLSRARLISLIICLLFSYFYNLSAIGPLVHG